MKAGRWTDDGRTMDGRRTTGLREILTAYLFLGVIHQRPGEHPPWAGLTFASCDRGHYLLCAAGVTYEEQARPPLPPVLPALPEPLSPGPQVSQVVMVQHLKEKLAGIATLGGYSLQKS